MGRREFLLIGGFVALGVIVYALTAPPARPDAGGRSFSDLWREMHTEMGGGVHAPFDSTATVPVDPVVRRLRVTTLRGELIVEGTNTSTVRAELSGEVVAVDKDRATTLAAGARIGLRQAGDTIEATAPTLSGRGAAQKLVLRVPKTFDVVFDVNEGPIEVRNVSGVRMLSGRADVVLENIEGEVRGEQRDGDLEIRTAGAVHLLLRNVSAHLEGISGIVSVEAADGDVEVSNVAGELRVDGRRADIELTDIDGPVEVTNTDGRVRVEALHTPLRIEGRRTEISLQITETAPVDANTTDDSIEVTLPPDGGATIDAVATDGDVRMEGIAIAVTTHEREMRARGEIDGGGPPLSLRVARGVVSVKK
jgi:hypothetical protein